MSAALIIQGITAALFVAMLVAYLFVAEPGVEARP